MDFRIMVAPNYVSLTEEEMEEYNRKVKSRGLRGKALAKYKATLKLKAMQKSALIGTLLGDSSITKYKSCVKFEQRGDRVKYVEHLYDIFEPFVGTGPKMRLIPGGVKGSFHKNYGVSCWFRTYSHVHLEFYQDLFYPPVGTQYEKRVPKNIHEYLDARALAYWFMDDGTNTGRCLVLNSQNFDKKGDMEILIKALDRNFGLEARKHKDKQYFKLGFTRDSSIDLVSIIEPYIHDYYLYKIELKGDKQNLKALLKRKEQIAMLEKTEGLALSEKKRQQLKKIED